MGVDAAIAPFWISGPIFLFNLSKHKTPYFMLYECQFLYNDIEYSMMAAKSEMKMHVLKMSPKLIQYNTYVEKIAL